MIFSKFDNKTTITGVIEATDPIHIGSSKNESLDPAAVDDSVIKDAAGDPIIPGSSLKGVLRSDFEAVMRSINKHICNVADAKSGSCVTNSFIKDITDMPISMEEKAKKLYEQSCDACRLFGGHGIASKLQFKDCSFIGSKCVYEYRDGIRIDPETGAAAGTAKFNYEIVPKGTRFSFYMTAENLDGDQKKYLEYIIRVLESGELSIGGKTSRGLGRIKLIDKHIKEITVSSLMEQLGLSEVK